MTRCYLNLTRSLKISLPQVLPLAWTSDPPSLSGPLGLFGLFQFIISTIGGSMSHRARQRLYLLLRKSSRNNPGYVEPASAYGSLAARTSTFSMAGAVAKSSDALAISAAATLPER